jgi:enterochelin esterase-like enzyme
MRAWVIAFVMVLTAAASAASPRSPRIDALEKAPKSAPELWARLAKDGTPIVEDVGDPRGRLLVTFVYRAKPGVTHVAAYGVPSGETANYARLVRVKATDVFAWSVLLEPSARFTYRLAPGDDFGPPVENDPHRDERNKLQRLDPLNPHLGTNMSVQIASLVELPAAPSNPWRVVRRDVATGTIVAHQLTSSALSGPRTLYVYTPAGFSTSHAPYPLVVMTDGQWVEPMYDISITLDNLFADKRIPPCVVAMIETTGDDRSREMPHDDAFSDFMALDVVPWLRRTYRATSDPKLTAISGLSAGGAAAVYAAYRHPEVFGNVISQSGSLWWGGKDADPLVDAELYARDYTARARLPVRFWLEVGHYEGHNAVSSMLSSNRHFYDVLVAKGYDASFRESASSHDIAHWRDSIAEALIATLGSPPHSRDPLPPTVGAAVGLDASPAKPDVANTAYRVAIIDGADAAVALLASDKLDPFVDLIYRLYYGGHVDAALPIAERAAKQFPTEANAFDTLGEAYARLGDKPHAIAAYEHAIKLAPKQSDNARVMLEYLR